MPLARGARLGPYEISGLLGAGGMGEVYRARDTRLGRDVAVKVIPGELAAHKDRLKRFEQEARATAALSHPNILALFDVGVDGDVHYIVEELLEGETLRERVRQTLALEVASAPGSGPAVAVATKQWRPWQVWALRGTLAAATVAAFVGVFVAGGRFTSRPVPSYRQLTFRRGTVGDARFAPDGQTLQCRMGGQALRGLRGSAGPRRSPGLLARPGSGTGWPAWW